MSDVQSSRTSEPYLSLTVHFTDIYVFVQSYACTFRAPKWPAAALTEGELPHTVQSRWGLIAALLASDHATVVTEGSREQSRAWDSWVLTRGPVCVSSNCRNCYNGQDSQCWGRTICSEAESRWALLIICDVKTSNLHKRDLCVLIIVSEIRADLVALDNTVRQSGNKRSCTSVWFNRNFAGKKKADNVKDTMRFELECLVLVQPVQAKATGLVRFLFSIITSGGKQLNTVQPLCSHSPSRSATFETHNSGSQVTECLEVITVSAWHPPGPDCIATGPLSEIAQT